MIQTRPHRPVDQLVAARVPGRAVEMLCPGIHAGADAWLEEAVGRIRLRCAAPDVDADAPDRRAA